MLRARPTRISLTDSEIQLRAEDIAIEKNLISEVEKLAVGSLRVFEENRPWDTSPMPSQHLSSVGSFGSDIVSCTEPASQTPIAKERSKPQTDNTAMMTRRSSIPPSDEVLLPSSLDSTIRTMSTRMAVPQHGGSDRSLASGKTPPPLRSAFPSSESTYRLGEDGQSPNTPVIVTSPSLNTTMESNSQRGFPDFFHPSAAAIVTETPQDQMSTNVSSNHAQEWPLPGHRFNLRRTVSSSQQHEIVPYLDSETTQPSYFYTSASPSSQTVAGSFECVHEESDAGYLWQLARQERIKQYVDIPSDLYPELLESCPSLGGLDFSLPRKFYSASYFPTSYERTIPFGSPMTEAENHDLPILEFQDTRTNSLFDDGASSDSLTSIMDSESSASEANPTSNSSDNESLSSLDDNFRESMLRSDVEGNISERIFRQSMAFRHAFESLVAQLENQEEDKVDDFGLHEVRSTPIGVWYRRQSRRDYFQ